MSNKKQSSVDWLFEQLCSEKFSWIKDSNGKIYFDKITSDLLQQAKAMHKEEMFEYIKQKYCIGRMSLEFHTLEFEQYYNETFGGQDNE